ncbi:MAG: hypothetical protein IKD47_05215 [Clostridia bacterium]|nr:hypothetical protein [Clostridia bacterium]
MNSKIDSYLGFCIRSRKILFGVDNIDEKRKGVFLIVVDSGISDNSMKVIKRAQERFACPILVTDKDCLGERLHRPAVKAAAILDKNLAAAILSAVDTEPQFKFYSGGNN